MEINLMLGSGDNACSSKVIKFKPYEIYKQVDMEVDISQELPIPKKNECNTKGQYNNIKEHKNNDLQKNHIKNNSNFDDILFVLVLCLILQMTCPQN